MAGYRQNNTGEAPVVRFPLSKSEIISEILRPIFYQTLSTWQYNMDMSWLTGGKQGKERRLIAQLADSTKREQAAQDVIRLGTNVLTILLKTPQKRDPNLPALYEQFLTRIPLDSTMLNLPLLKMTISQH